jgi:hypothetical protein
VKKYTHMQITVIDVADSLVKGSSRLSGLEIHRLLWNPEYHYCVHNSAEVYFILSET